MRRRQGRPRHAPWQPLAALIGVAGALWFAADLHPDAAGGNHPVTPRGNDTLVLKGTGAAAPSRNRVVVLRENDAGATSGNGIFTLCTQPSQQNCVIDGDTIRYGGAKIRLENIDTPETHEPRCASEAARGRRATRRLLELINAGPFQLVRTGGRDEDRYGRKLRTITRNGRSVGDVLIAEGLAPLGWRPAQLVRLTLPQVRCRQDTDKRALPRALTLRLQEAGKAAVDAKGRRGPTSTARAIIAA